MKKFRIYIVVFLISYLALVKPANAILPLIYTGIVAAADATAALTTSQAIGSALIGIGLGTLIGQRLGLISFHGDDGTSNGVDVRIPLTNLPQDRPVSSPNAPPNATQIAGNNFSDTSIQGCRSDNGSTWGFCDTTMAACQTNYAPLTGGRTCLARRVSDGQIIGGYATSGYTSSHPLYPPTNQCPAGYSISGANCNLTSPQSIPDAKLDVDNTSSNIFVARPNDADYPISLPSGGLNITPQMVTAPVKVDGHPYPVNTIIQPPPASDGSWAGGICATGVCVPVPGHYRITGMSNTSTGTANAVVIDVNKDTGVVTQAQSVPLTGQIISGGSQYVNTNGSTVTVPQGSYVLVRPVGGTLQQVSAVNTSIDTTNLAKTGEAAVAAGTINTTLNEHLTGTQDFVTPAQESINQSYDTIQDSISPNPADLPEINISWLPSLLPGPVQTCMPFVFSVNPTFGAAAGLIGTGTIDICDKLGFARALFGWFLGVVTVFFVFRAFIRSNMGA